MMSVKCGMDESRQIATPIAMKLHERKPEEKACNPTIYQMMIGNHMYAMTATGCNIAYAIRVCIWSHHDLSNEHMVALKWVFLYLNNMK